MGIYYEPYEMRPAELDRASRGLRPDACVFWCAQALFKYLPDAFPRVAAAVPGCQFVFIEDARSSYLGEVFRRRLGAAFSARGLRAGDHCVFLPTQSPAGFLGAMGNADVFLDTIGWSGCNTTRESLIHDIPIVTLRGGSPRYAGHA